MKQISRVLLILPLIVLAACSFTVLRGSGNVITENRVISSIRSVDLSAYGDLNISQGDAESLSIQGDDNIVAHIITEVNNGRLSIRFDESWGTLYTPSETLEFNLTVKNLESITFSGAGTIHSDNLALDDLAINLSGAGSITIEELQADNLTINLSGAGSLHIEGSVTNESISLSGVGNFNAEDLSAQNATISLTGAGNASLWVAANLNIHISGAGSINYYGTPKITKDVTGIGSLNYKGTK
jgi:hypothetical protein